MKMVESRARVNGSKAAIRVPPSCVFYRGIDIPEREAWGTTAIAAVLENPWGSHAKKARTRFFSCVDDHIVLRLFAYPRVFTASENRDRTTSADSGC